MSRMLRDLGIFSCRGTWTVFVRGKAETKLKMIGMKTWDAEPSVCEPCPSNGTGTEVRLSVRFPDARWLKSKAVCIVAKWFRLVSRAVAVWGTLFKRFESQTNCNRQDRWMNEKRMMPCDFMVRLFVISRLSVFMGTRIFYECNSRRSEMIYFASSLRDLPRCDPFLEK